MEKLGRGVSAAALRLPVSSRMPVICLGLLLCPAAPPALPSHVRLPVWRVFCMACTAAPRPLCAYFTRILTMTKCRCAANSPWTCDQRDDPARPTWPAEEPTCPPLEGARHSLHRSLSGGRPPRGSAGGIGPGLRLHVERRLRISGL